ncbi:MAG: NDP-sugar synthase [Acidobacteriota bacterium]|nr:NDP-sugar synthase [Acidobacteriota bacterium]
MPSPLPCLVLTAGLGTRLRPLTDVLAKPALPVSGQPLVSRILRSLAQQGVTEAVLNLSHLPHTVTACAGDGGEFGLRVRYSWEQPVLGSAGGPRHALPLLDSPRFLIVNGDTLTDVAIADVIAAHASSGAAVTMALVPHPAPGRYGGVRVRDDGRVERFTGRAETSDAPLWHYIGVQVVEAHVFADLPDNEPAESVGGIYKDLLKRGLVHAHRSDAAFRDIGRPEDYIETTLAVAREEGNATGAVVEAGARVDPGAKLDRVIVWSGSDVGAGVHLTNCVVAGARIAAGTHADGECIMAGA